MSTDSCLTHYLVTDLGGITRGRGAWGPAGGELCNRMSEDFTLMRGAGWSAA